MIVELDNCGKTDSGSHIPTTSVCSLLLPIISVMNVNGGDMRARVCEREHIRRMGITW